MTLSAPRGEHAVAKASLPQPRRKNRVRTFNKFSRAIWSGMCILVSSDFSVSDDFSRYPRPAFVPVVLRLLVNRV